jgi:primosomal protein N' (replication factor Y)
LYLPDANLDLMVPRVRAAEDALRKWCNDAALLRSGGVVIAHVDPAHEAYQALVRWDPIGFADRELHRRSEAGLPPAVRLVQLDGSESLVDGIVAALAERLQHVRVLGPRLLHEGEPEDMLRVLFTASDGQRLVDTVRELVLLSSASSTRNVAMPRMQVDPPQVD